MLSFVHIYKSGGKTIRSILRRNFAHQHCDLYGLYRDRPILTRDWQILRYCYPVLASIGGHDVKPSSLENINPSARFYTFLRDPVERSFSHYQNLIRQRNVNTPFADWMAENANRQTRMIAGETNVARALEILDSKIGFVGLTESFDESLVMWKKWTGFDNLNINYKAKNVARSNHIRNQVRQNQLNLELCRQHNQLDQVIYDYVVNHIYPRQQAAYGNYLEDDLKQFLNDQSNFHEPFIPSLYARAKRNFLLRPSIKISLKLSSGSPVGIPMS